MDTVFSETISTVILLECLPVCCASGQRVAEGVSSAVTFRTVSRAVFALCVF